MKWPRILLLIIVIVTGKFFSLSAQPVTQNRNIGSSKTYAVIIGITNYQNPAIPALQFADKDAEQFAAYLQSKAGGLVPQTNISLLLNHEATVAAIYNALDWLKEQCKENDEAYIYFAGHGDVETKNNFSKGYLLAYNSPQNNYANNAIRIEDFNNASITLTTKNKAKVIIISDACRSGKLAGDFYKGKQLVAGQLSRVLNNQVRIASCKEDELAAEGPNWGGGRGVFSYYLVMGLQGLAALKNDTTIHLNRLSQYLDSCFAADKFLAQNKFSQHPVTDGNPNFTMANIDLASLTTIKERVNKNLVSGSNLPVGLLSLKPLQRQPIDYFFSTAAPVAIESFLDFKEYDSIETTTLALKIVNDCKAYQTMLYRQRDTSQNTEISYEAYEVFNLDSLNMLSKELQQNTAMHKRFVEKFIQLVHEKGQDMINAYLKGDLDELEKRQYYYSGKRDYKNYISMLQLALKLVSPDHQLAHILQVHYYYLNGVIERMQMATFTNTDSLLALAFYNERQALKLEPYAAYILNELGNLHLHQKNYDSAHYYFNLASSISPTWAIPWSNQIKMNLEFGHLDKAEQAIHTADSLQPNLAYVLINAGLVMEKKKNLLAAESFYLRAIKENNVHYLPYERLAHIYLNTARFDKANYFFYSAQTRKEDFAVNDKNFDYGIELGGLTWNETDGQQVLGCAGDLPENATGNLYLKLFLTIQKADSLAKEDRLIKSLQEIINQKPGIPLAYHYLAKEYYKKGNWQLAQQAIEKSLLNTYSDDDLLNKVIKDIVGNKASPTDTCMLKPFLNLQFDVLEDYYMLADLLEKMGDNDKAFVQYKQISALENKRQMEQAGYKNYAKLVRNYSGILPELNNYLTKIFGNPIIMTGAIKAARLHIKLGQYAAAEEILLQQVSLSRAAGAERQKAIKEKRPGWDVNGVGNINFYWLAINSYLESETFNFYKQMLMLFPREALWQMKAGQFLYHRLQLAFKQVPVEQYQSFYKSISKYAYPWKSAVEQNEDYRFSIPGTGDSIIILCDTFDPVKESLAAINLAVKYSADVKPDIENAKALADLYSWVGNTAQSVHWFQQALVLQPADAGFRSHYAVYLGSCDLLPEACKQLQILVDQKKSTPQQIIQLADWQFLSGKSAEASKLLQKIKPVDNIEKRKLMVIKARTNFLQGNTKLALHYLRDSMLLYTINENEDFSTSSEKEFQNAIHLYFIARLNAILNKNELAFAALKQSLDAGFNFEYVLYYDKAWEPIRHSEKWNKLVNESGYRYDLQMPETNINPIRYRIPGMVEPGR